MLALARSGRSPIAVRTCDGSIAAKARGAGRDRQSLQVQRDDQRLAFNAVEINVSRIRHAGRGFAVQTRRFDLEQFLFQVVPCSRHFQIVAAFQASAGQFGCLA